MGLAAECKMPQGSNKRAWGARPAVASPSRSGEDRAWWQHPHGRVHGTQRLAHCLSPGWARGGSYSLVRLTMQSGACITRMHARPEMHAHGNTKPPSSFGGDVACGVVWRSLGTRLTTLTCKCGASGSVITPWLLLTSFLSADDFSVEFCAAVASSKPPDLTAANSQGTHQTFSLVLLSPESQQKTPTYFLLKLHLSHVDVSLGFPLAP